MKKSAAILLVLSVFVTTSAFAGFSLGSLGKNCKVKAANEKRKEAAKYNKSHKKKIAVCKKTRKKGSDELKKCLASANKVHKAQLAVAGVKFKTALKKCKK